MTYPLTRPEFEYSSGKRGPTPVGVVIGIILIILSILLGIFAKSGYLTFGGVFVGFLAMLSIRIAAEWERAVILRVGKYSRMVGPGLFIIIPFFETTYKVDLRVRVWDVRPQEIMSADSVPVEVDAVVYYKIVDPKKAIMNVEDFAFASVKMAQTTLRDIVGKSDLDRLLMKKEEIGNDIKIILDKATDPLKYGLLRSDLTPRPAYIAYQVLTQQLDGYEFDQQLIVSGKPRIQAYRFDKEGVKKLVLWRDSGERIKRQDKDAAETIICGPIALKCGRSPSLTVAGRTEIV